MGDKPSNSFVLCPHEFQQFVGCDDVTARLLAGWVCDYVKDYASLYTPDEDELRLTQCDPSILMARIFSPNDEDYDLRLMQTNSFICMTAFLLDYGVFSTSIDGWLLFRRYERLPTDKELRDKTLFRKYIRRTENEMTCIPCSAPEIIRAFADFCGKRVDPDIIFDDFGLFDDPDFDCPICGKNWGKPWK